MATGFLGLVSSLGSRLFRRGFPVRQLRDFNQFQNPWTYQPKSEDFLGIPAVWSSVRLIASTIASLPLKLYQRDQDNGRTALSAKGHPIAGIFAKPNHHQTEIEIREELVFSALVYGYGFAEIFFDDLGRAVSLSPIPFKDVQEDTNGTTGERVWRVNEHDGTGRSRIVPDSAMFCFSGFMGKGLADICSKSLELTRAAQEYALAVFENGAQPGGTLTVPGVLSQEAAERLRREWERRHSGIGNSFRTAILQGGATYSANNGSNQTAQAVEMREFQVAECARVFGIPISKLRDGASNSPEGTQIVFLQDCIRPYLVRFEELASKKLLLDGEKSSLYWEHSIDGILRADIVSRFKAYSVAKNWGILSSNEIRKLENYPSIPGGDTYLSPVNMSPLVPDLGAPGARAPSSDSPLSADMSIDESTPADDILPAEGGVTAQPSAKAAAQVAGGSADVASTALNGAQIASLVELVNQVGQGLVPPASAKAIAQASFPFLAQAVIDSIFDPVQVRPVAQVVTQEKAP
jgi:HK97 family phage portal protein